MKRFRFRWCSRQKGSLPHILALLSPSGRSLQGVIHKTPSIHGANLFADEIRALMRSGPLASMVPRKKQTNGFAGHRAEMGMEDKLATKTSPGEVSRSAG